VRLATHLLPVPSAAPLPFPLPSFVACRATTSGLRVRHTNFDNRISYSISLSVFHVVLLLCSVPSCLSANTASWQAERCCSAGTRCAAALCEMVKETDSP